MRLTKEQLLERLPKKDFWLAQEIADAFEVTRRTIQYAASRHKIGNKVRHGPRGTYVFQEDDLDRLCNHIYGEVGNPHMRVKTDITAETLVKHFLGIQK